MQPTESAADRSRDSYDSNSEEDEDDKALALEVENAIAAVHNSNSRPVTEYKVEEAENEFLQICAKNIEELKKTTGNVQGSVKVEYKPMELKFSDEVFLEQLSKKEKISGVVDNENDDDEKKEEEKGGVVLTYRRSEIIIMLCIKY